MKGSSNPEIQRLLGVSGEYGQMLGLAPDWAYQVIKAIGNYGESFDRNIGPTTAIGLERGLNALWTKGGILYAPPFR
jgi:general L-amino acid transport system substrate-binding protein